MRKMILKGRAWLFHHELLKLYRPNCVFFHSVELTSLNHWTLSVANFCSSTRGTEVMTMFVELSIDLARLGYLLTHKRRTLAR